MISNEKILAVRKQLKNGTPHGELQIQLIKEGYSEEDIRKVFVAHEYDMRSWYLVFAIIFLLGGIPAFLQYDSLLLIIAAAILFYLYYKERQKITKRRSL